MILSGCFVCLLFVLLLCVVLSERGIKSFMTSICVQKNEKLIKTEGTEAEVT